VVQQNNSFNPNTWVEFFPHTHIGGRNINEIPRDTFPGPTFLPLDLTVEFHIHKSRVRCGHARFFLMSQMPARACG
jgi:hypothetical protein